MHKALGDIHNLLFQNLETIVNVKWNKFVLFILKQAKYIDHISRVRIIFYVNFFLFEFYFMWIFCLFVTPQKFIPNVLIDLRYCFLFWVSL